MFWAIWTETLPGVRSMRSWPEFLRSSLSSWHLMQSILVEWLTLGHPFWRLPTLILHSCTCQTSFLHLLIGHTWLSSVVACLIFLNSMVGLATCPGSFSCDTCMVPSSTRCTAQWITTAWVKDSGCGLMHCVALAREHLFGWAHSALLLLHCVKVNTHLGSFGAETPHHCKYGPLAESFRTCGGQSPAICLAPLLQKGQMEHSLDWRSPWQHLAFTPVRTCVWSWSSWSVSVLLQAPVRCTCQVSLANLMPIQCPLVSWWVDLPPNSLPACTCKIKCHQFKSSRSWKKCGGMPCMMWMMKSLFFEHCNTAEILSCSCLNVTAYYLFIFLTSGLCADFLTGSLEHLITGMLSLHLALDHLIISNSFAYPKISRNMLFLTFGESRQY